MRHHVAGTNEAAVGKDARAVRVRADGLMADEGKDSFFVWRQEVLRSTVGALEHLIPGVEVAPSELHKAIRYAVFSGGKRVRPMLCHAAGELVDAPREIVGKVSAAIEMVHIYSLVQDDLPVMDNDIFRHGVLTVHAKYDTATALLVCDALITLAFQVICELRLPEHRRVRIAHEFARTLGSRGVTGGQFLDIVSTGKFLGQSEVELIHTMKTGALIRSSLELGALCCRSEEVPDDEFLGALARLGSLIGHAYQVMDDILDFAGNESVMGKTKGKDKRDGKSTYVTLLGIQGARDYLDELRRSACELVEFWGDRSRRLREIVDFLLARDV